ncbi:MAG: signal peptide peptidase SppA [Acaryochloridaceae cyanobacterium SU_2_1]|nr:signal peptide peptidase SppA [Acaryochloridaceae cyanobacterium SU_2_1]
MRLDRILALTLITLCLVAALGNLLGGPPSSWEDADGANATMGDANVALLNIYGTISDAEATGLFSSAEGANANQLIKSIQDAREDQQIKAILLRINSPGGTAAASEAVYEELMRTRKETDIKIIASLGDVAASGGYYIASAAHHIVANPATVTGSIGVILRSQNVSGLLNKVGVQTSTFQSGPYKDILSPFRESKPKEREILQGIVDDSYDQFLKAIVAGRSITLSQLKPLAEGQIFTGAQAKAVNLVDSLGNYTDALQKTAEIAKIKGKPQVRDFGKANPFGDWDLFSTARVQQWLPDFAKAQSMGWQNIPLTLME